MNASARALWYSRAQVLAAAGILLLVPLVAGAVEGVPKAAKGGLPPEACAMLDDVELRSRMDGLLLKLIIMCDRPDLLGQVPSEPEMGGPGNPEAGGVDVLVNNPGGDSGASRTQSETSLALNEVTGTICSGYNDSYHGVTQGTGYAGFSRSTDGGATFTDRGSMNNSSCYGDPSIVWRKSDGYFYYATLFGSGLAMWRSTDDCTTFPYLGMIHSGSSDDKELLAVDNNPSSPYYGRLYCVWTDFGAGQVIRSTYSDNGTNWSSPVTLNSGSGPQGAWPVIAPNGDVYVSWANGLFTGTMNIAVARSTNGGAAYSLVTSPATSKTEPRDAAASGNCGRPSLRGNIRYLPSPQIAVGPDGAVHVVYSYDPDGYNTGDVVDAFYRRSTDNGATWGPEVRLNTDATTRDQFFPTLSIGAGNIVSTTWYDRRDDPNNTLFKYYQRFSFDGGVTWEPDEAVSDVASSVVLDPNLATCYHGDYDTHVQTGTHAVAQWSDDRTQATQTDPNVYVDLLPISTDFLLLPQDTDLAVCSPDSAVVTIDVPQFSGFSEPVTLSTGALPPGLVAGFVPNPVTPPGSTVLTLSGTGGVAAGSYDLQVIGTSSPSGFVHDTTITFGVFTAAPGATSLLTPVNAALNQPLRPAFSWSAATQAASYTLEVDDDPAFGSPALVEAGITETTFTPSADLASNTTFYWRVTPDNTCGTGPVSTVYSFTTEALPGDCGIGTIPLVAFTEDFESGAAGWAHSGTGDTWALSGARVHGGAFSYHADGVGSSTDQRLVSPEMMLPTDSPVTMQFWNWQSMEPAGAGSCYDGGILEISTDGGSTWTYLPTTVMQTDPYDGPVYGLTGNPEGWCGDPQDWLRSVVDLDAYAGQTVRFRFRLGTDGSVSREGWYLDDAVIQSCIPSAPDFTLGATPGSVTICAGDSADYTVNVGSISGFANDVTLAASGNPADASFSVNPVTPPGSSLLTIGNTGGVGGGSYGMTISGTASGSSGHSTGVTLNVVVPSAPPTLTSPANGAVNQPLRPVFQWGVAAGADSYALEVDNDPAFGSPEISVAGIFGTTYTPTTDLDDATTYYWRVRSENLCGPGTASTTFSFTTLSLLPFEDGFESGDTGSWSSTAP